jgi:hypothetical protein
MSYDRLREPGKHLSTPNELSLQRPWAEIGSPLILGFNRKEGSASAMS